MARTPLIPLNGTEDQRQACVAEDLIDHNELNATTDQFRLFLGDIPVTSVWHGVVTLDEMLDLFNTEDRGCFPGDMCVCSNTNTLYLCIARVGLDLADWQALITVSTDVTLGGGSGGPSDALVPTQKAVKAYADIYAGEILGMLSPVQSGVAVLNQGDTSASIIFSSAFATVPVVEIQVQRPSGSDDTVPDWDAIEIGVNGFTARGQPIPSDGYVLHWFAIGTGIGSVGGSGGTVTGFSAGNLSPFFTTSVGAPTTTPVLFFSLNTVAANKVLAGPVSGADAIWAARALVAADIPALSYAPSALTSAHLFVGNVSNVATDVAMTGDISITNAGVTAIGANKVTLAMMATIANNTVLGNISGGAAVPSALTVPILSGLVIAAASDSRFYIYVDKTTTTDVLRRGCYSQIRVDTTAGAITQRQVGIYGKSYFSAGSNAATELDGTIGEVQANTPATLAAAYGIQGLVSALAASSVITKAYGLYSLIYTEDGGSIGTGYGLYIDSAGGARPTTSWGIYQVDTGSPNYFGGNITTAGSLTTGAPAGGTAGAWKMGIWVNTPTVATGYIQVDVGGTLYEIPAKVH